ncbi:flagellar hook-length control protein FliK [Vogesella sp. GCM10023246]|uniref:Flagellar hook-length control protein FliK n=1 Tax=Vogesella oryzagri TaxID=3160864 RepID=A0ABV1M759_9NEIS
MLSNLSPASSEPRQTAGSDDSAPVAQPQPAVAAFAALLQAAQPPADPVSPTDDATVAAADSDAAADTDSDSDSAADSAAANLALLGAGLLPLQLPSQAAAQPQPDASAPLADGSSYAIGASTATAPRAAAERPAPLPPLAAISNNRRDDASNSVAANLAPPRAGSVPAAARTAGAEQLAALLAAGGSRQDSAGEGIADAPSAAGVASPAMPGTVATAQPPAAQWAPLKLPASQPAQWGQALQQALGERLRVQAGNGIDNAVIRLDPPHLGSLEIAIRHEAGSLQVQLTAGNGELLRQLHAISDSLRQGLGNRQYGEVAVWVADSRQQHAGQGGQGRQGEPREQRPGQALYEAEQGYAQAAFTLA